ncbi:hypothetical protein T492DRAFT_1070211 [Pavlovales sp. CCMP2436]|nr:hypothetical protein T492DRAFT_1070211 [Pavlovales sp. CCMP2436]
MNGAEGAGLGRRAALASALVVGAGVLSPVAPAFAAMTETSDDNMDLVAFGIAFASALYQFYTTQTSTRVKRDGARILDRGRPEVDEAEDDVILKKEDLRVFSQNLPMTTVPAPSDEGVYVLRVPAERDVQEYLAIAPCQMLLIVGPKGVGQEHAGAARAHGSPWQGSDRIQRRDDRNADVPGHR